MGDHQEYEDLRGVSLVDDNDNSSEFNTVREIMASEHHFPQQQSPQDQESNIAAMESPEEEVVVDSEIIPIELLHAVEDTNGNDKLYPYLSELNELVDFILQVQTANVEAQEKILYDDKSQGDTCAICLEDFLPATELTRMPCSHHFHGHCLLPWLSRNLSCPLCRFRLW